MANNQSFSDDMANDASTLKNNAQTAYDVGKQLNKLYHAGQAGAASGGAAGAAGGATTGAAASGGAAAGTATGAAGGVAAGAAAGSAVPVVGTAIGAAAGGVGSALNHNKESFKARSSVAATRKKENTNASQMITGVVGGILVAIFLLIMSCFAFIGLIPKAVYKITSQTINMINDLRDGSNEEEEEPEEENSAPEEDGEGFEEENGDDVGWIIQDSDELWQETIFLEASLGETKEMPMAVAAVVPKQYALTFSFNIFEWLGEKMNAIIDTVEELGQKIVTAISDFYAEEGSDEEEGAFLKETDTERPLVKAGLEDEETKGFFDTGESCQMAVNDIREVMTNAYNAMIEEIKQKCIENNWDVNKTLAEFYKNTPPTSSGDIVYIAAFFSMMEDYNKLQYEEYLEKLNEMARNYYHLEFTSVVDTDGTESDIPEEEEEGEDTETSPEEESMTFVELQNVLQGMYEELSGRWAVYVQDLESGEVIDINSHRQEAASLIKLFIMGAVYEKVEAGAITEDDSLTRLLTDMITVSDNEAANTLVRMLGGGSDADGMAVVNDYAQRNGYNDTHMGRMLLADATNYDNYTSVKDCSLFLERVYKNQCGTAESSTKMLGFLKGQKRLSKIPAGVPSGTMTANKTGELDDTENDVAIIYSPEGDYILSVMATDLSDVAGARSSITSISSSVYKYFDPTVQDKAYGKVEITVAGVEGLYEMYGVKKDDLFPTGTMDGEDVYAESATYEDVVLSIKKMFEMLLDEYGIETSGALGWNMTGGRSIEEIQAFLDALPSGVSGNRKMVLAYAYSLVGQIPYVWGGHATKAGWNDNWNSGGGLDCAGYVAWAFQSAGIDTYPFDSYTGTFLDCGPKRITKAELQPGDIGLRSENMSSSNHIAIYAGNGLWLHAWGTGLGIVLNDAPESSFTVFITNPRLDGDDLWTGLESFTGPSGSEELFFYMKFESGNEAYNNAGGDGGRACGAFQFDYRYGLLKFVVWCYEGKYGNQEIYVPFEPFVGLPWSSDDPVGWPYEHCPSLKGNQAFFDAWHKVYNNNPVAFANAQNQFEIDKYLTPTENWLANNGINMQARSDVCRGAVLSIANLYGPSATAGRKVLNAGITNTDSDRVFLEKFYNYILNTCDPLYLPRFQQEKALALTLVGG